MFTWLKQGTRVHLCGDVWFTKTLCTFVQVILWEWFRDGIRLCALVLACVCEWIRVWGIEWMRDYERVLVWVSDCVQNDLLTGGEPAPEEHVEQVLRSDVTLKAPVEVEAPWLGLAWTARLLPPCEVILSSFVSVAQHGIRIANLWRKTTATCVNVDRRSNAYLVNISGEWQN